MRLADETPGTRRLFAQYRQQIWDRSDRMFLWLLLAQWLAATAAALWASPEPWDGLFAHLPSLAYKAFGLGAVISILPVIVALRHPGSGLTRREIAVGQGLMTSLLIHVSGGRPEMHYVVFASLPFLAMYRDISVLLLASMITVVDHVLGCFLYPQSVYGVAQVSPWAWVNDVGLLAVENALLSLAIRKSQRDLLVAAREKAAIEASKAALEREVAERQRTERLLSLQYIITRVLAGAHSLPEAAPVILRIVGENQGWHVGELWEVDDNHGVLRCVDLWHADSFRDGDYLDRRRALTIAPDVGLAGRVWQRHLPL